MQSHQRPSIITPAASIVEQQHEQQLGPIIPCKIYNNNKNTDKSPILSSEFEFFNPLIKSGSNKLSNKKQSSNNTKNSKLTRTVSDFGKISVENVRANDHQKKNSLSNNGNVGVKLVKSDYSLSKVAQLQQQQQQHHIANDDVADDEISPLLVDTNTNNLTIKVITDDKNVLLFTKKSVANVSSNNGSCEQSTAVTISDKDKENLVKYQKRQNLKLPLNGGYYYNNKSDKSEVKEPSETGNGSSGAEKQKNNWRHSWYAPVYGVLEEETETIKVRNIFFFVQAG